MTHLHKMTCPERHTLPARCGFGNFLLYFARHGEEFIQIENVWISTVIVTLVIIQFIKGNTLMVLECLLETENGVNFNRQTDRLTWCTSIGSS